MKKIINQPADIVSEMVSGLTRAYPDFVKRLDGTNVLVKTEQTSQVQLISGGGSGHEPSHAGFIGDGMLAAAVCGEVFTSPTPDQIYEAAKAVDTGSGVFFIIKNYSGDVMNFDMAKDMAEIADIQVEFVIVDDDIAVENSTYTQGKRGVAGTVLVHKILGNLARSGADLVTIKQAADKLVPEIHTIAVDLSGATVPEVGKPGFVLPEDEIEYGVGIHGEPGYRREKMLPSKDLAKELVDKLVLAFEGDTTSEYAILVNGMGAMPLMEQFIFTNDVMNLLDDKSIKVAYTKVGNLMTSIDMAGISLTMLRLSDATWLDDLNADVKTIAWG